MNAPSATSPLARYRQELAEAVLKPDAAQAAVVEVLERVHRDLCRAPRAQPGAGLLSSVRRRLKPPAPVAPPRGAYLWGGVGRGKTHLMNGFYDSLPFPEKLREHFHRFMQRIHAELRGLRDQERPLRVVADRIAERTRVVCLDEFHVSDIGDAMLLGGLLEALFARGVALVTTSNMAPDELYREGLQRARFLPAIEALKRHTEVVAVAAGEDFRLRALERAEIYHHPLDAGAEASLRRSLASLHPENLVEGGAIEVLGRSIPAEARADGVVWFRFECICDGPRGTMDYIEIARCYHTVIISEVPVMGPRETDRAQRFISLVDEFYDRNVNLIVTAAAPPAALYPEGRRVFEFQRTVSRLEEMQSHAYLARSHLP